MAETINPPGLILFLLWPFKGESCYPQIVGDMNEEFYQRVTEKGELAAYQWFYREVVRNFISLVFRWVTIPVIILPLLCIILIDLLHYRLFILSFPYNRSFLSDPLVCLILLSFFGLSLGVICSRILRGREWILCLACGVCYIGYSIIELHMQDYNLLRFFEIHFIVLFDYVLSQYSYIKLWTVMFMCIGIIWAERRHLRRQTA